MRLHKQTWEYCTSHHMSCPVIPIWVVRENTNVNNEAEETRCRYGSGQAQVCISPLMGVKIAASVQVRIES